MKNLFFLFSILSFTVSAQVDTVSLKKIRAEFVFEPGLLNGNGSIVDALPYSADIFLNSNKKYGTQVQYGGQVYFYNKIITEAHYTHDKYNSDSKKIAEEIKVSNGNYFIQEEPKYSRSEAHSNRNYDLHFLKAGLALNFRLTKSKYLQPFGMYVIGKATFPDGKYAYKELTSNDVYYNDFYFKSTSMTGYTVGIRYKYFADANIEEPSSLYGDIGIKVEFASMIIKGNGRVLQTDGITKWETEQHFDFTKKYQYITIGVFFAVGYKGKKFSNNFLFSSRPYKRNKVMRKMFFEERK